MSRTTPLLSGLNRSAWRTVALALALVAAHSPAQAHDGGMSGFATIAIGGKTVRYQLKLSDVPPGPLADRMRLGVPGAGPDYSALIAALREKIILTADGARCVPDDGSVTPPSAAAVSLIGSLSSHSC